jgi:hypothetical protein
LGSGGALIAPVAPWSAWSAHAAVIGIPAAGDLHAGELSCRHGQQFLRSAAAGVQARSPPAPALRSLRPLGSQCRVRGLGPRRTYPRLAGRPGRKPPGPVCLIAVHRRCLGDARRHEHGGGSYKGCAAGQIGPDIGLLVFAYGRMTAFAPLAHPLQPPEIRVSATGSKTALPLGHAERSSHAGRMSR